MGIIRYACENKREAEEGLSHAAEVTMGCRGNMYCPKRTGSTHLRVGYTGGGRDIVSEICNISCMYFQFVIQHKQVTSFISALDYLPSTS